MMPTALRALPWLATLGLALACDPAPKSSSESAPADGTTTKTETETVTKSETTKKPETSGETKSTETVAKPDPVTKTETAAPGVPPKPVTARAVVFFREAPKDRVKLWALPEATAPDPTAARELGITADPAGGSIYHGSSGPVLSGDGQWLAYLDDGRLELARLDGTAKHRITKHRGNKVEVLIAGFTPDSSRLMFHQAEVQGEEPVPLPKGVVVGFHELTLADLKLAPKTSLESFTAFTDDGRHVIFQRTLPDRSTALFRFDLDTGADEELQRTTEAFGFSQPVLHGDRIAFVHHPAQGKSRVAADALRGGARIELSPEGGFAQYQWPHIAPDGQHVSFTDEQALRVRTFDDDATRTLVTCSNRHCDHTWDSATTVLVLDGEQLSRVSLDGTTTVLASDVVGFVVAGAPG